MKILITGASGRIGLPIVREIYKIGMPISLLDKFPPSKEVSSYIKEYIEGDILDSKVWEKALSGIEIVIHLAAISKDVCTTLRTNLISTHMLARYAAETDVKKIVFASSNCVVGHCDTLSSLPFEAQYFPIDEAHPHIHESDYGLSKYLGEKVLEAAVRKYQFKVIALRLGWVWSKNQCEELRSETSNSRNKHIDAIWNYIHEEDCAAAFRLAVEKTIPNKFEVMYVSAKDTLSYTPSQVLARQYFPLARISDDWTNNSYPSFFSWKKANRLLGYEPKFSWREHS